MRAALAFAIALLTAGGAFAQETAPPAPVIPFVVPADPSVNVAIVTVDLERLFLTSQFGIRIVQDYNDGRAELAVENSRIVQALREEELALAAARPDMDPAVFRTEANAFDEKAQGIRRAQDAKVAALEALLENGRTQFLDVSRPILGQLMVDNGAFAVLDRRTVVVSLGSIDVTDEAIARINAALGDGTDTQDDPQTQTPDN